MQNSSFDEVDSESQIIAKQVEDYYNGSSTRLNEEEYKTRMESFMQNLKYEIEDIEQNSTTIDFGIEDDSDIKLFEHVDDVAKFSRELRDRAWR
ncbi:MAG: hypothetical protein U9N49_06490 [Campylobacterota bacterium]|nr:hypothetical protein [Campylobacterota bacterium]